MSTRVTDTNEFLRRGPRLPHFGEVKRAILRRTQLDLVGIFFLRPSRHAVNRSYDWVDQKGEVITSSQSNVVSAGEEYAPRAMRRPPLPETVGEALIRIARAGLLSDVEALIEHSGNGLMSEMNSIQVFQLPRPQSAEPLSLAEWLEEQTASAAKIVDACCADPGAERTEKISGPFAFLALEKQARFAAGLEGLSVATNVTIARPNLELGSIQARFTAPGFMDHSHESHVVFLDESGAVLRRLKPVIRNIGDVDLAVVRKRFGIPHPDPAYGDVVEGETILEALGRMERPDAVRTVIRANIDGAVEDTERTCFKMKLNDRVPREADWCGVSVYPVPEGRTLRECLAG